MDSSASLLRLHSNPIHHTNDHPNHFDAISSSHHPFNPSSHHSHLAEFLTHSDNNRSKPDQLPFPLPLPNFLIDPQDGQFTPYFDRSPASSPGQEYDDPMEFNLPSPPSSPMIPISPLRSRATSVALKKLIEIQAQKLLDISAAWKKKYPDDVEFGFDAINAYRSGSSCDEDDVQQVAPEEESCKDVKSDVAVPLTTSKLVITRQHRSLSQKSVTGFSSDRLSLNDYRTSRNDTKTPRPPQKVEVENWKREVAESKLKMQATKDWVHQLPVAEHFEQIPPGLDLASSFPLT